MSLDYLFDSTFGLAALAAFLWHLRRRNKGLTAELRRISSTFDRAFHGLFRLDHRSRYLTINEAYASMLGYTPRELSGRDACDLVHPEDRAAVRAVLASLPRGGKGEVETRAVRRDGSVFHQQWVLIHPADSGEAVYCGVQDISERKKSEEALRASEQQFQAIARLAPVGIFRAGPDGDCTYINERWADISGLPLSAAFKGGWLKAVHPDDRERVRLEWARSVSTGELFRLEYRLLRPDGQVRWLLGQALAETDSSGKRIGFVGTVTDITERKRAEENEALQRREAMQREFVANVSHEFRTPLAVIKGFAATLRDGAVHDRKNGPKFIQTIEKHADRLSRMVEDLLELSSMDAGKAQAKSESIALSAFTLKCLQRVSNSVRKKGLSVRNRIPPGLKVVIGRDDLGKVLKNLLDNAVDYNRPGGRIDIYSDRQEDHTVVVSVSDTGIGIPPQDLPHIFERFHRTQPARALEAEKPGLGLSVVKSIIDSRGGRVWAENRPGGGTTLRFTLKVAS